MRQGLSKNYRVKQLVAEVAAKKLKREAKVEERKWKRRLAATEKDEIERATAKCEQDERRSLPSWKREIEEAKVYTKQSVRARRKDRKKKNWAKWNASNVRKAREDDIALAVLADMKKEQQK